MAQRRCNLVSVGAVLRELGAIYRAAHRGTLTWENAGQAARILREIRHCLESSDLEARLKLLEDQAAREPEGSPWQAVNGTGQHARH